MDRLPVSINPCPIAEAIFEVRFETTYPGDAIFGIIYNQFKDEFPKVTKMPVLQLPAVVREQDPNLQFTPHYKMSGDNYIIQLGPNVFSLINTGPYRGWDAFSEKILESYNKISALKIIEKHQRTALRYINVFEGADIFDKSTLSLRLENDDLSGLKTNMTIEMPYDYGVRILRMVNFARAGIEAKMVEGSIIDIDTHVAIEKCAGLEDAISKAHLAEKQLFFGLLQKDFIATLNPVY
jgi:uncharacterized protein (TIGR04255 family)